MAAPERYIVPTEPHIFVVKKAALDTVPALIEDAFDGVDSTFSDLAYGGFAGVSAIIHDFMAGEPDKIAELQEMPLFTNESPYELNPAIRTRIGIRPTDYMTIGLLNQSVALLNIAKGASALRAMTEPEEDVSGDDPAKRRASTHELIRDGVLGDIPVTGVSMRFEQAHRNGLYEPTASVELHTYADPSLRPEKHAFFSTVTALRSERGGEVMAFFDGGQMKRDKFVTFSPPGRDKAGKFGKLLRTITQRKPAGKN